MDAHHVKESGFPLELFPEKLQSIALSLTSTDDYLVEFIGSAMLSVASTAIGNSHQIHVRGSWISNPSLYMVFVGRPGIGKTPPLKFLFTPLYNVDDLLLDKYKEELRQYEQLKSMKKSGEDIGSIIEPTLVQYVLGDFTPEALWRTHDSNKRGVVLYVDEIMGMFNTVNRYSNGNLIEQLLSAFSGSPIKVTRLGSPVPLYLSKPCINIIGTLQTDRVNELLAKGYEANGLLDRFIFVKPLKQIISEWSLDEDTDGVSEPVRTEWTAIINRLLSIEPVLDDRGNPIPITMNWGKEAKERFYTWRNGMMNEVNAIRNDSDVDTRVMKRPLVAAKLALIMQLLRWACNESHKDFVDEKSVEAAISLSDYYEDCWVRVKSDLSMECVGTRDERFLQMLGDNFTTQEA